MSSDDKMFEEIFKRRYSNKPTNPNNSSSYKRDLSSLLYNRSLKTHDIETATEILKETLNDNSEEINRIIKNSGNDLNLSNVECSLDAQHPELYLKNLPCRGKYENCKNDEVTAEDLQNLFKPKHKITGDSIKTKYSKSSPTAKIPKVEEQTNEKALPDIRTFFTSTKPKVGHNYLAKSPPNPKATSDAANQLPQSSKDFSSFFSNNIEESETTSKMEIVTNKNTIIERTQSDPASQNTLPSTSVARTNSYEFTPKQSITKSISFTPSYTNNIFKTSDADPFKPKAFINAPVEQKIPQNKMIERIESPRVTNPSTTVQAPNAGSDFRTATEELYIQNMKKNSNNNPANQNNQQPLFNFAKKSLGFRLNGPKKVQENNSVKKKEEVVEEIDERLKHIDPDMIESIRNEIIVKDSNISWDDIAGLNYAKDIIQEAVIWPLLRPDIFTGLRRPPRGILLFGPPGTGKTLIGKCIASQSKSTFFNISAATLTSKWIGVGEKMVRALFAVAVVHQPAVVFIDEIDSLLTQRSESEHESSRRMKTEFLVQLDGAATAEDERILIVGATNRPQELDEAVRRRLTKRLYIPLPEIEARVQILIKLMNSEKCCLNSNEVQEIAKQTDGYSGADMKVLCQEASMIAIRSLLKSCNSERMQSMAKEDVRDVNFEDFQVALTRVRASVSSNDLTQYIDWDKLYGSGAAF